MSICFLGIYSFELVVSVLVEYYRDDLIFWYRCSVMECFSVEEKLRSVVLGVVQIGLVVHDVDLSETFLDKVDMSSERRVEAFELGLFRFDEYGEFRADRLRIVSDEKPFYRFMFGFIVCLCGES